MEFVSESIFASASAFGFRFLWGLFILAGSVQTLRNSGNKILIVLEAIAEDHHSNSRECT
jgi:hypothetical protein